MSRMTLKSGLVCALLAAAGCVPEASGSDAPTAVGASALQPESHVVEPVFYRSAQIDGQTIAYREAGRRDRPVLLLLHGFPTSSHMYRGLISTLADEYHIIAPDYPGFGTSAAPPLGSFDYSFDNLARIVGKLTEQLGLRRYSMYWMDYGAPIGQRLALQHPERVQALIVQNGNSYAEGLDNDFWRLVGRYWAERSPANEAPLRGFLTLAGTQFQYLTGVRDPAVISPDNWLVVQPLLDRPGNNEIQLQLFYDYRNNVPLYPAVQSYFRTRQPPTLIVWGKNDPVFAIGGATAYLRDLPRAQLHLLNTGHFALEEDGAVIAGLMRRFLRENVR